MDQESQSWYAIRVRSRSERLASAELTAREVQVFPAIAPHRRVWSDRVRVVNLPLFPGYIFGFFRRSQRSLIESTPGVAAVVRFGAQDVPVDPTEIEAVRILTGSGLEVMRSPHLQVGRQVMVLRGPLKGAQGLLLEVKDHHQLVISVSLLQRSVSVEIDEAMVAPMGLPAVGPKRFSASDRLA